MLVGYKSVCGIVRKSTNRAESACRGSWSALEWDILDKREQGVLVIEKLLHMFS